ncbi:MAG: hypothetical protein R6T89_04445 [Candidatus Syntrophosphaera sp.]
MAKFGFDLPAVPRKTFLYDLEEKWYLPLLAKKRELHEKPVKRSNFGEYHMAVNYLTSVLEEAAAVNDIAAKFSIITLFWSKFTHSIPITPCLPMVKLRL